MNAISSRDSSMEEKVPVLTCEICTEPVTEDNNNNFVPSLTCEICIEPMTENNNYFNNENSCAHPFCIDCIAKYIEAKLMEENTVEVSCPALNCGQLLDPLACRSILPAGLFERWCDLLCESAVLRCDDQIQSSVYCPFTDCSALVLNECENGNTITKSECPNCKKLFCFHCKIPWHVGLRCNQTDELQLRDENDILFGELVERNKWIRCPRCKFYVMKIEGCQNIKCRCGVLFCYVCGKIKSACYCDRGNVALELGPPRNVRDVRDPLNLRDPVQVIDYLWEGGSMFDKMIVAIFLILPYCFVYVGLPAVMFYWAIKG